MPGRTRPRQNPYRAEAIEGGWDPKRWNNRTGYDTLFDDMSAQRRGLPYADFITQKYGASPQDLRQADRAAARPERPFDPVAAHAATLGDRPGFGSGESLAGVTDFDQWAGVQRNPEYRAGREAFADLQPGPTAAPSPAPSHADQPFYQNEGRPILGGVPNDRPAYHNEGRPIMGNFTSGRRRRPRGGRRGAGRGGVGFSNFMGGI